MNTILDFLKKAKKDQPLWLVVYVTLCVLFCVGFILYHLFSNDDIHARLFPFSPWVIGDEARSEMMLFIPLISIFSAFLGGFVFYLNRDRKLYELDSERREFERNAKKIGEIEDHLGEHWRSVIYDESTYKNFLELNSSKGWVEYNLKEIQERIDSRNKEGDSDYVNREEEEALEKAKKIQELKERLLSGLADMG